MLPQDTMTSRNGFIIAKDKTQTGSFVGFVTWTDVSVTALEINNVAVGVVQHGFSTITIPAGSTILFANDENVTSITFTGTIYLIRR